LEDYQLAINLFFLIHDWRGIQAISRGKGFEREVSLLNWTHKVAISMPKLPFFKLKLKGLIKPIIEFSIFSQIQNIIINKQIFWLLITSILSM
jgi:hypothetical protein